MNFVFEAKQSNTH